jgi:uncharacterized protein
MIKTQIVIVQPTPFCNINCRYCYLPYRTSKQRISFVTISQIFKLFFSSPFAADEITVVWHAGEPLILPISFYEQAFQCIEQENIHKIRITHSFQTNATLITHGWCDFFKRYQAQVGVSLDGPQHIHDAQRVDRANKGTFKSAMHGIRLLQEHNLQFSVIAVVTEHTLQHAEEFWKFFMDLRPTRLGLNPEVAEGVNATSTLHTETAMLRYKAFIRDLLKWHDCTPEPIRIREIEYLIDYLHHCSPFIRSQTNVPGTILSFDCDGNISTFSPELLTVTRPNGGNFRFGNVFEGTLQDSFTTEKFIQVNKQIQEGVLKCEQTCDHFMFCGGGFPANKIYENGSFDSTETNACRLRVKATVDALLEHLEERYHIDPPQAEST